MGLFKMVEYTDILKAVNKKIKAHFPDITILAEGDVKEKILRPSFMTRLDSISSSKFNMNIRDKSATVIIRYFPKNRYKNKIELYNVIDELDKLFYYDNFLETSKDYLISIDGDITVDIPDNILNYSFEVEFCQEITKKNNSVKNMEKLEIKEG